MIKITDREYRIKYNFGFESWEDKKQPYSLYFKSFLAVLFFAAICACAIYCFASYLVVSIIILPLQVGDEFRKNKKEHLFNGAIHGIIKSVKNINY